MCRKIGIKSAVKHTSHLVMMNYELVYDTALLNAFCILHIESRIKVGKKYFNVILTQFTFCNSAMK